MRNVDPRRVETATAKLLALAEGEPVQIGLILGSGFAQYADTLANRRSAAFTELGLPKTRAVGHSGVMHYAKVHGLGVLAAQGRIHNYEGHSARTVVLAVRSMIRAGAKIIIVTCAAGSLNRDLTVGKLVLLTNHVNRTGDSPLRGTNVESFGPRFVDMTNPYDRGLRDVAIAAAGKIGLDVGRGVYAMNHGPEYETHAEILELRDGHVDLVGMSTVYEVIAARHMAAKVMGIACVTNAAAGIGAGELSHEDVIAVGKAAAGDFARLMDATLAELSTKMS